MQRQLKNLRLLLIRLESKVLKGINLKSWKLISKLLLLKINLKNSTKNWLKRDQNCFKIKNVLSMNKIFNWINLISKINCLRKRKILTKDNSNQANKKFWTKRRILSKSLNLLRRDKLIKLLSTKANTTEKKKNWNYK